MKYNVWYRVKYNMCYVILSACNKQRTIISSNNDGALLVLLFQKAFCTLHEKMKLAAALIQIKKVKGRKYLLP